MLGLKAMHVIKSDPGDAYFSMNWVVIDSGIGLVPVRHQAITLNDDESLLIGRLKNLKQLNLTPNICLVFQVNLSHNMDNRVLSSTAGLEIFIPVNTSLSLTRMKSWYLEMQQTLLIIIMCCFVS